MSPDVSLSRGVGGWPPTLAVTGSDPSPTAPAGFVGERDFVEEDAS